MQIIGGTINGGFIKDGAVVIASTMRSVLSAAGQSAYDSTTVGNWFNVSSSDYANVFSGLSSVSKYGLTDAQISVGNTAWSAGYAQAFGANLNAQLSSGTYVIGFTTKVNSGTGNVSPLISNTLPTTGTYRPIANFISAGSGNLAYYLRRAPTATTGTSYLGIVGNVNMTTNQTITSGVQNWYSSSGAPNYGPPWTVYGANPILFQALGTPTQQW